MSGGLSFGMLPTFADLDPAAQAAVMQRLQAQYGQGNQQAAPPAAAAPGGLLGEVDPQTTGAIPGQSGLPVAMNEHQVQGLERDMGSAQDRAAPGSVPGSPDALLYDRGGMGGGPGGFAGSADPMGSRMVPTPPQRPSDADLLTPPTATGSVSGMNPGALRGQFVATSAYHPNSPGTDQAAPGSTPTGGYPGGAGEFDPFTGQRLSDQPRSLGTPQGAVSPAGAAAATGASSGLGGGSVLERFAQGASAGNPDLSNLLLHVGMGLMSKRGFGEGISAGLQSYSSNQASSVKNLLEQVKLQQTLQGQQAIRQAFAGKGLSPAMVEAAALDPTVRSSVLAQINRQPQQIDYNGERYMGVPGTDPSTWQHLGSAGAPLDQEVKKADALASVADAHAKDDIVLQSDGQGGTIAVRKSSLFPDKASAGGAGEGGTPGGAGTDPNIRTIVPPQPDKKANEGLDKLIGDNITGGYQKAQGAVGTLAAISRQKEALDKGVIAGAGADWRTKAQSLAAQYLGIDPSQLNDSYSFDAASTQKQAELAKAVSQAGHTTNMDLALGKTIAGGDRTKTEQALRQIVDAQETLARDAIDRHNASLDKYSKIAPEAAARTGFFKVETPEVYKYGQGTPNPLADPGARLPASNAIPSLDVNQSHEFNGMKIRRVR